MTQINWSSTKGEIEIIVKIAKRTTKSFPQFDHMHAIMNIKATHANGNPLKLQELLNANDSDFAHDIWGIEEHLNKDTGKLQNCFVPRLSA